MAFIDSASCSARRPVSPFGFLRVRPSKSFPLLINLLMLRSFKRTVCCAVTIIQLTDFVHGSVLNPPASAFVPLPVAAGFYVIEARVYSAEGFADSVNMNACDPATVIPLVTDRFGYRGRPHDCAT